MDHAVCDCARKADDSEKIPLINMPDCRGSAVTVSLLQDLLPDLSASDQAAVRQAVACALI